MSNYEKLKNDELKKLLTERGLPTTGKKADFVARLVEMDESKRSKEASGPAKPAATTTKPVSTSTPAETKKQVPASSTAKTSPETPSAPSTSTKNTAPSKSELPEVSNDDREAKLAARAARFGISVSEQEEKKKNRAKRFGLESSTPETHPEDKPLSQPKAKGETQQPKKKEKTDKTGSSAAVKAESKVAEKRKVSILDDPVEAEKARKRASKYGIATPSVSTETSQPSKEPVATST